MTDKLVEQKALPGGTAYMLPERPKVYHNLPQPDYGNFVGREAELKKITDILRPYPQSQHALVTIDGIGGIGKSALALEIGHRFLRNFDDLPPDERFEAIIWASAKLTILTAEGISTRRQILRTLDDIYNALAIGLQREDITRARKEDQDEVVRNALTRQRTLLIVDNLETVDDEAVLTFLRELPAPTKAIVTTRHRLDVAYPVRLTGMPLDDAQQLIRQECEKKGVTLDLDEKKTASFDSAQDDSHVAQNDGRAAQNDGRAALNNSHGERSRTMSNAQRLFERTGGVPLAMVWSIAQMGFGYGVETVLHRLGQPTSDISRFCFEGAVERISGKPAHKLLMVLSLCAESASRELLGYATELAEFDRDDGLVELEKLSLVNKSGDRFWLLPLTKQYASAEFEKSAEKEQLQGKWIEYFIMSCQNYSSKYWNWKNYEWLLAEGNNIISIVNWTINSEYPEIALSFTRAVMFYLDRTGHWVELFEYGEKLYMLAQTLNNKILIAWIGSFWLGYFYLELGNLDKAELLTKQSLYLYREMNDIKGICLCMSDLGRVFRLRENYKASQEICEQAIELAKKHRYDDGVAANYFELGKLKRDQREWHDSKKFFEFTIKWLENHEQDTDLDIALMMMSIGNLGWVECRLGNFEDGKRLLEQSLTFFEKLGGRANLTTLQWRLATAEKVIGNKDKALKYIQESYFWAERLGMARELEGAKALLNELNAEPPAA